MAVRTKRLFVGHSGASGASTIYTAPAGETVIVKSVNLYGLAGTPGQLILRVLPSSGPTTPLLRVSLANAVSLLLEPWWVLQPGDSLTILTGTTDSYAILISGTELEGVAD